MPGLRHAHTLQQLQHGCWILTPGRVFKQPKISLNKKQKEQQKNKSSDLPTNK